MRFKIIDTRDNSTVAYVDTMEKVNMIIGDNKHYVYQVVKVKFDTTSH